MNKISLIISYYKRTDYLKLIFAALKKQTLTDFEVIIADAGSPEENVKEIEMMCRDIPYKVVHIWHEDIGFRKNKILNKAITASESEYLVFIDGDCMPHPEFLKEHYTNRERGFCLTGRRVNLSQKITDKLNYDKYSFPALHEIFYDSIFGNTKDAEKGIYLRNKFLRKIFNKKKRGLLGCNFSVHKEDILNINGFDERYTAPSIGEDSDIQYRLELNGIKIKSLNNIAVQYHLYHKLQPRPQQNIDLFEEVKRSGKAFTEYGIRQEKISI